METSITFLLPVYVGDTVTAHFVVRSIDRARHRLQIDSWIENEAGARVDGSVRGGAASAERLAIGH